MALLHPKAERGSGFDAEMLANALNRGADIVAKGAISAIPGGRDYRN
jgi:hypothetical protein